MTLTAGGLLATTIGVILLAMTIWGFVKDGDGRQGDVSWLGLKLRKRGVDPKYEKWADRWGQWLGWVLIVFGFVLQFVDEVWL